VYTFPATGFAPIPLLTLPFPSIVVASEDDPWVSLERAGFFAERWGSRFQNIGKAGHINLAAGFGPWPQGLELLQQL
jgi:predicted alpha/beta hydrolase family esterase